MAVAESGLGARVLAGVAGIGLDVQYLAAFDELEFGLEFADAVEQAADGLADIRVGRNILHLRRAAQVAQGPASDTLNRLLSEVGDLFRLRQRKGMALPASHAILSALDDAVAAIQTIGHDGRRHQALLAAVGMRCNLFPNERHPEVRAA